MDLRKTEIIQKTLIVILFITTLIITFCGYKQELEIISYAKENESLKLKIVNLEGQIEMQKSAIADLEENLRRK